MQEVLAPDTLFFITANQRKVHQPVSANGGRGNSMPSLECIQFRNTFVGRNGVGGSTVIIEYPFDVVEAGFTGTGYFLSP